MAQTTTLILLPQTAYNSNTTSAVGTAQKAAGYYLGNRNLQTVVWDFTSVNAVMIIEASLADTPVTDSDWFEVFKVDTGGISTQRDFQTIEGNFVWIRCRVPTLSSGVIQSVKVSY